MRIGYSHLCPPVARGPGCRNWSTPPACLFSGGWAISYDKPGLPGSTPEGIPCISCGRGAFGIADTGLEITGDEFQIWPFSKQWSDGSQAGYELEGETGPQSLAYVQVRGQRCLYNVWSFLGRDHLEYLLQ